MAENHQHAWKAATPADTRALSWRSAAWRALQAPTLLLVIMVAFYWRLTLTRQYTWLDNPDDVYQVLPWFQFQASAFHHGRFPLWDPYEWGGQPLLAQVQPGAAYPINWILFALPLRNGFIRLGYVQWYFVLIHFTAALFCYWLCRDLNRSRPASLLAGVAFGIAGWFGSTDWPQMLNSALWTPLIFLFLFRVGRGHRPVPSAAFAGTFLGVAFLAGHHQIPIFVGLAAAGFWLHVVFRGGKLHWELWRPLLIFAVFGFAAGALQTLPAYEYGKLSLRWVGATQPVGWSEAVPYDIHTGFGLFPLSVLGIVVPGIVRNANPYIGMVLLSLAFFGIATGWNQKAVRWAAGLALGGLIFALAEFGFFQGFLYGLLPMVDKARNPSMAIFIFHFGIVLLSAFGIDSYDHIKGSIWTHRVQRILLVFSGVLYLALLLRTLGSFQGGPDPNPIAMAGFSSLLLTLAVYAWSKERITSRTAYAFVFALMLIEAALFNGSEWRNRDQPTFLLKKIHQESDIALILKQRNVPLRLEIDAGQVPYNFGDWYGLEVFGGYLASLTSNVSRVQGLYQARMLAGVNLYVGAQPTRSNQVSLFNSSSGLHVFSNPEAFPPVWTVHQVERITSANEVVPHLEKLLPALRDRAFLVGVAPQLETCSGPDEVRLINREFDSLAVAAKMQCRGMLVVGDSFYPGWRANIDGRDAQILEVYGFLRGIIVERGEHRVEMHYRPRSVFWGAVLTASSLLAAALIAGAGLLNRKN